MPPHSPPNCGRGGIFKTGWDELAGGGAMARPRQATAAGPVNGFLDLATVKDATGEALDVLLDLDTWRSGSDLAEIYREVNRIVSEATAQEDKIQEGIRAAIFPRLANRCPGGGVYRAKTPLLEQLHQNLLFAGKVEVCDGTNVPFHSLPLTMMQIGVVLVSYKGDENTWVQRMYRREVTVSDQDPIGAAVAAVEGRFGGHSYDADSGEEETPRDKVARLVRRGIMAYVERAALLEKATAPWRMGHGNPLTVELLNGSGLPQLAERSLVMLRQLVLDHRRFLFVPSSSPNYLLTIGNALAPFEYAVVETLEHYVLNVIRSQAERYVPLPPDLIDALRRFAKDVGSQVVRGLYRASPLAPPQTFFAHVDHVHEAAHIALADSMMLEHRGFPLLIDLADQLCRMTFDNQSFTSIASLAQVDAGHPWRYRSERSTR